MKVSKDAAKAASRIFSLCAPDGQLDEDKFRKAVIQEARVIVKMKCRSALALI